MKSTTFLAKNPHPWSTPRCFDSGICDPLPDATDEQRRDYYSRKSLDDSETILCWVALAVVVGVCAVVVAWLAGGLS